MSQETQRHEMTRKTVVLELPGMDVVTIQRDVRFMLYPLYSFARRTAL